MKLEIAPGGAQLLAGDDRHAYLMLACETWVMTAFSLLGCYDAQDLPALSLYVVPGSYRGLHEEAEAGEDGVSRVLCPVSCVQQSCAQAFFFFLSQFHSWTSRFQTAFQWFVWHAFVWHQHVPASLAWTRGMHKTASLLASGRSNVVRRSRSPSAT